MALGSYFLRDGDSNDPKETYSARVIADSASPDGVRLTTLEVTFPRIVLAEFNTHRVFSRNSASSRAIPVKKRIAAIERNPYVPSKFAANKRGMQAGEALDDSDAQKARDAWNRAREAAIEQASQLAEIGVHKQWANRLLEPFAWHTVIVSSTEWENYFALRVHGDAQPEIKWASELMLHAMESSFPEQKQPGEWHLPFVGIDPADWEIAEEGLVKISVARCARVSHLTHDGVRDTDADSGLYDRLTTAGHMSPTEHAAQVSGLLSQADGLHHQAAYGEPECVRCGAFIPADDPKCPAPLFIGNFRAPWVQHRKLIPGEAVFRGGA